MTDVFISYAHEDRETAQGLAAALEARGWSVWWDREIPVGQSFDQVIERQLEAAKSVVVLWSKNSAASEWVKNEAAYAAEKGVLIPALLLSKARPPLEFRRRQAADLEGWGGDPSHAGFRRLCDAITAATTTGVVATVPSPFTPVGRRPRWGSLWALIAFAAVAIAIAAYWAHRQELGESHQVQATGAGQAKTPAEPTAELRGGSDRQRREPGESHQVQATGSPAKTPAEPTAELRGGSDRQTQGPGESHQVQATGSPAKTPAELTAELRGGSDEVVQLAQLANGTLASSSSREVKIWSLTTLREESAITGATRPIAALPDNKMLASRGGDVVVWGPFSAPEEKSLEKVTGSWGALDDLVVGDGKVIGCSLVGGIAVWSLATGKLERHIQVRLVVKLLLLRDGRLVTGRTNGMIEIWNVSSGEPQVLVREGTTSNDWIKALVELHDGRLAYTTQGGTAVHIWSHISNKDSVAFTPGTRASGSKTTLATTPGTRPYGLALLANGQLAILEEGSGKQRVSIWNRDASRRSGLFEFDSKLTGTFHFGTNLVPLQDGRFATGGYGRVQIWKLPGTGS